MVGINAAVKLKAAGITYRVVEQRHELGGTWSQNVYPNVAVDTPSIQYSYSFDLNPSWSKFYPAGHEYLAYLKDVAAKHGILDKIDFGTSMERCVWDEGRKMWVVTCTRDGVEHDYEANVVISALGFLNRPAYPKVEGLERFKGPVLHPAQWDPTVNLKGKKVVLVGTGSTAAQVSTGMADIVADLSIIQRQPTWVMPNEQVFEPVNPHERWALENIPFVMQWIRIQSLATLLTWREGVMTIDAEWRAKTGGVSALNDAIRKVALDYIGSKFADRPDLKTKVTPDFPFFAKRPILDCGYYDTLKKKNVTLVQGALARCEDEAVILADGARLECDVLVLATGFQLEFLTSYDVRGRGGQTLQNAFTPFPYAYLGLEVPGFPNFFITCGPNSALTASHTTTGEQQVHYIIEALQLMVENNLASIEVTQEATNLYNDGIAKDLERTVWVQSGTAHGYYRHASGRVVLAYPRTNVQYWKALREPVLADHRVSERVSPRAAAVKRVVAG
jgi:cation diffusion facilitator CzcD-associated flavoprotein CzcO